MKLGFIGYGEAARAIAEGLQENGLAREDVYGWSRSIAQADPASLNVTPAASVEEMFRLCRVVICITPASASVSVAEQCRQYMTPEHIYVDVSSSSPSVMQQVWERIRDTGVQFADGALLDTVPKYRHKVPTVLAGNGAQAAAEALSRYNWNVEVVGTQPGSACAIKMLRSVYTKSLLGICFEMLEAAAHYGIEDYIMHSLAETMDQKDFVSGMNGRTCGGVIHAARRSEELMMAAQMLQEDGLDCGVCLASAEKLAQIGRLNLKQTLGDYRPKTWKEAVACVIRAKEAQN